MYKQKYLVLKDENNIEYPMVFSSLMNHSDVAFGFRNMEVVSGGFCSVGSGKYSCYGESISCRVKSRGKVDDEILNEYMGLGDRF